MSIEIRRATAADHEDVIHTDGRAFGSSMDADDVERRRAILDHDRFRVATEDGTVVGVAGSFAKQLTLPGGTTVAMGGLTYVGVLATHRRRGLLRKLIAACHDDMRDRGEPLAGLLASESGIYERFGYGKATDAWEVFIDRHRTRLRAGVEPSGGHVRYVDGDEAAAHVSAIWERGRRLRAGELSRSAAWHTHVFHGRTQRAGTFSPAFYLAHPDGYAVYRIEQQWNSGHPSHLLDVIEFVAVDAAAHLELWSTIFGVDLVGQIRCRLLPIDDPLPYLLADPRALRTAGLTDWLWVAPFDVSMCLASRRYDVADRLVVEVDGQRVAVEGGPDGATATKVRTRPDLIVTGAALGALLLGGVSASRLVAGHRGEARNAAALRRADAFFRTAVAPHCQTGF